METIKTQTIIIEPGYDYTFLYETDGNFVAKHIFKHKETNLKFHHVASYVADHYENANILIDINGCGMAIADELSRLGISYDTIQHYIHRVVEVVE